MGWRDELVGRPVLDAQGEKLGLVDQVYSDPAYGPTTWAQLRTGTFGSGPKVIVPIDSLLDRQDALCIPYTRAKVQYAPETEDPPTANDTARLAAFYGLTTPVGTDISAPSSLESGRRAEIDQGADSANPWPATVPGPLPAAPASRLPEHMTVSELADLAGQLVEYGQQLSDHGHQIAGVAQRLGRDSLSPEHIKRLTRPAGSPAHATGRGLPRVSGQKGATTRPRM